MDFGAVSPSHLGDFLFSNEAIQGHVAVLFILLNGDTDDTLDLTELNCIQEKIGILIIIDNTVLSNTVYETYIPRGIDPVKKSSIDAQGFSRRLIF